MALGDHDPLQACLDEMAGTFVHDRGLARRLPALVRGCGFESARFRGHSFVETAEAGYMQTIVDRSDTSHASGRFGEGMAEALKAWAGGGGIVLQTYRLREPRRWQALVGTAPRYGSSQPLAFTEQVLIHPSVWKSRSRKFGQSL